jgi:hypothetical protein
MGAVQQDHNVETMNTNKVKPSAVVISDSTGKLIVVRGKEVEELTLPVIAKVDLAGQFDADIIDDLVVSLTALKKLL